MTAYCHRSTEPLSPHLLPSGPLTTRPFRTATGGTTLWPWRLRREALGRPRRGAGLMAQKQEAQHPASIDKASNEGRPPQPMTVAMS